MPRSFPFIALAIALIVLVTAAPAAVAQVQNPVLTVIAVDEGAAGNENDVDMLETALDAVFKSIHRGNVALVTYGELEVSVSTILTISEARSEVAALVHRFRQETGPERSGQVLALTKIFSLMGTKQAPPGSKAYLFTPGRIHGESEATVAQLQISGELFSDHGWQVDVFTLPSAALPLRELMSTVAARAGGQYYDLGVGSGVVTLLHDFAELDLEIVKDAELNPGAPTITTVEIAPRTRSFDVAYIRLRSDTEVSLFRPNGASADQDFANIRVDVLPNTVVYSVSEPTPGTWRLQALGDGGKLLAGIEIGNPLVLELVPQLPLRIGEPGEIQARVTVDGRAQPLASAFVVATIRHPDGITRVYQLEDKGVGGDAAAGDGVYSVRIPAPVAQGVNDVDLELSWADFDAVVRGDGTFQTDYFPELSVLHSEREAQAGKESRVLTIEVTDHGFPHPVSASELSGTAEGPGGTVPLRIDAVSLVSEGLAWQFDVFAEFSQSGAYSFDIALDSVHLDRPFHSTLHVPSFDVRPIPPTPTPVPTWTPVPTFTPVPTPTPTPTPTPVVTPSEPVAPPESGGGFPQWIWIVVGLIAITVVVVPIWHMTRRRPFGYLYDDSDRLVVDFAGVERSGARNFLAPDILWAREIPDLPFDGGALRFARNNTVALHYARAEGDSSLRVDGRPAGRVTLLREDTWLGVSGRLLRFVPERLERPDDSDAPQDEEAEGGSPASPRP